MNHLYATILALGISLLLAGCAHDIYDKPLDKEVDRLYIHPDGKMVFRGRTMSEKNVVIYEDGKGGEKAAVKVYVPLHPDFFRDTIVVERIGEDKQSEDE